MCGANELGRRGCSGVYWKNAWYVRHELNGVFRSLKIAVMGDLKRGSRDPEGRDGRSEGGRERIFGHVLRE